MAASPFSGMANALRAQAVLLGAIGAVALLLGASMAHASYTEVERTARSQELSRWAEGARFTYGVPVENSTLIPNGTILPMGEPAYFRTVSDEIRVNFTWKAAEPRDLVGAGHAELALRVRADAGGGRSYWEIVHVLDEGMFGDPSRGVNLSGVVELDAIEAEVTRASAELPPQGAVNWTVVASVKYALEGEDLAEAGSSGFTLPITLSEVRFLLPAPEALQWDTPHVRTGTVVTERPAGWPEVLANVRALGLLLGGTGLLAGVALARRTDPARGLDPGESAFQREHAKHKEWVTTAAGGVQERDLRPPVVDVDKLEDLVTAAMDARTRVLLDPRRRVYYAVLPTLTYRYARHARFLGRESVQRAKPRP